MVSNPERRAQMYYVYIERFLTKELIQFKEGISYKYLIKSLLMNYPIKRSLMEDHIKEFYIDEGLVLLEGDNLKFNGGQ